MFEIELKAHVRNREELLAELKNFATYEKTVERNDLYYGKKIESENSTLKSIAVRLRKESKETEQGSEIKNIFTYKQKETKRTSSEIETELNDEKECTVSDFTPIEEFLKDSGFILSLHKKKSVEGYILKTDVGMANIEVCNVPPLGDFIEIEILSKTKDEKTVKNIQKELISILQRCKISESDIESKYYSEMLREAQETALRSK